MCTIKDDPKDMPYRVAHYFWCISEQGHADEQFHDERLDDDVEGVEYLCIITHEQHQQYPELDGYYAIFVTNEDGKPFAQALTENAFNQWHIAEYGY